MKMAQTATESDDFPGQLLHQAALWDNVELLMDLLQEESHLVNALDSWGRGAIHAAAITADSKCLPLLVTYGADVNLKCGPRGDFKTPLHLSAEHGHASNVKVLLASNASFVVKDVNGLTPLDVANRCSQSTCVDLLQNSADAREQVRQMKHKELREAVSSDDETVVKVLLDALGPEKEIIVNMAPAGANTLLFLACQSGFESIVNMLLDAGSDGRAHPVTKYSPLYTAVHHGHTKVAKLLLDRFPELIQQLTVERWSPLHAACINGHTSSVELLLHYKYPEELMSTFRHPTGLWEWRLAFDPNTQDVTGQTALYVACLLGNKPMVDLLLHWKVLFTSVDMPESSGAAAVVFKQLSPTKKRISYGIQSIMSRLSLGNDHIEEASCEEYRCALQLDILCGAPRETALLAAVRGGYLDVVTLLLQNDADPNVVARPIEDQNDPKSSDEIYGFSNMPIAEAASQKSLPMVELLLKFGAKDDEATALNIACLNDDEPIICRLLSKKAHQDLDFKINKKALDKNINTVMQAITNVTYNSLFPSVPTMINWHCSNVCQLSYIKVSWLLAAVLHCNPKIRDNPNLKGVALGAITRIDISHNNLTSVPDELFYMCSLRSLNLAQNKLECLPSLRGSPTAERFGRNSKSEQKDYNCPLIEEIYLQDNRLEHLPSAIFRFPCLITLDVSNNKIQELPFEMWKSPKLRELNVAFNLLKDLPVKVLLPDQKSQPTEPPSPVAEAYLFNQLEDLSSNPYKSRMVSQIELVHHHIWHKSLEITEQELRFSDSKLFESVSQLSSLNLANNLFTSIPLALPCLAVNLTRLNLSYNSLRSMGHVTSYPASLKQLDLSHNEITCWPSLPRISTSDPHLACYSPTKASQESKPGSKTQPANPSYMNDVTVIKAPNAASINSLRNAVLKSVCCHRRHLRLESLRTLVLGDNLLTRIQLSTDDITTFNDSEDTEWSLVGVSKSRLIFPNISMLDISNNCLKEIPPSIHELTNLSVLNISGNVDITELPPHMGLLSRLWNLNTRGCSLQDPLRSMIESKKYKTMDIIGYLKSVYEDARPYARMKLMVVGVQGIGKTSLLELLRHESSGRNKKSVDHWAKRMGHKNINTKTSRGVNMSTVGVDIGDWICEKKIRGNSSYGPVLFRTWDFGGQKEYYATHQYFLSKRSLYVVVWRIIDGKKGVAEVLQWLGNIQARAPNSPVIIVGTHYDVVGEMYPARKAEELQQIIRDRFIAVADAEKMGLPRVLDSIEVSCKTNHNIKLLANLIYDTAFSLRSPGSKELLLRQKVPASYLALEDVVGSIANALKQAGGDPVLNSDNYKQLVTQEMSNHNYRGFRDWSELNQATMFLHDNGVLLHYDDSTLRELYFLDPQWLCDMLAHVVTVREINPFARTGIMKLADLQHVFKSSCLGAANNRGYIVSLLNKFEVALTWDARTLLIPSLLPAEEQTCLESAVKIRIATRTKAWNLRSKRCMTPETGTDAAKFDAEAIAKSSIDSVTIIPRPEVAVSRLLLMSYFPSGFWSRLITRILADDQFLEALRNIYPLPKQIISNIDMLQILNMSTYWTLWQTGFALYYGKILIFKMREVPSGCPYSPYRSTQNRFKLKQDGIWCDIDVANSSILEIYFPSHAICIHDIDILGKESSQSVEIEINKQCMSQLLALCVDHIDILLEDWYPTLGTRFVHTSEGRFLVTRLIPCPKCLRRTDDKKETAPPKSMSRVFGKDSRKRELGESSGLNDLIGILNEERVVGGGVAARQSQDSIVWSDCDSGVGPDSACSSRTTSIEGHPLINLNESFMAIIYSWMIEECILAAYDNKSVVCPVHGDIDLRIISPDVMFMDLSESYLIKSEDISKGPLLGRGAFGFVFKASCKLRGSRATVPVAMKMLQPVPPGPRAKESAIIAYKAALGKWERDPLQHACKAYCTARQEMAVLLTLKHPNIVPLVGICTQPLSLVLDWAPKGALDIVLRDFRRSGARIGPYCFQSLVLQAARAIEYLHRRRVIYRDLKAENVLVWEFPEPHGEDNPLNDVHIKVADYGISRITLPFGAKGFGGTEGFMAPEIMRHNGEEEYTEKVDCFSFGMFLYELIALRQPFEGHEAVKECILEGGRPVLTQREAQFPCYCLDLMVLCWDQQPQIRPSASQIVSIASAPEFTHLVDVISFSHNGSTCSAVAFSVGNYDDEFLSYEVWIPCSNSRIDLLTGSHKGWQDYHRILCPQIVTARMPNYTAPMRLTAACIVEKSVWVGDQDGNIYGFNSADCTHLFSYSLEPTQPSAVISLVYLDKISRVAAGLENGRLFLLDSKLIPTSCVSGEGSFVLTELGSGEKLYSICALWRNDSCEIWCGEIDSVINVFTLRDSVVSGRKTLSHFNASFPLRGLIVSLMYATDNHVFSYISPGCILYMWNAVTKEVENRLDCSKLVPCSESLKSIAIEEHLSPGKCQITALTALNSVLYVGTSWGCLIVVEEKTLRPITIFRPYEDELMNIVAIPGIHQNSQSPLIVTIGKGYRSLISRYTDVTVSQVTTPSSCERRFVHSKEMAKDRSRNFHALIWKAENWAPV